VLKQADAVLLADVYPAGEPPIDGATSAALAQAAGLPTPCAIGAMPSAIAAAARDRDVVITMGAGTIGQVPARLRESTGGPA
jgi:UDP-N-acetylmuramate--alanine ligase